MGEGPNSHSTRLANHSDSRCVLGTHSVCQASGAPHGTTCVCGAGRGNRLGCTVTSGWLREPFTSIGGHIGRARADPRPTSSAGPGTKQDSAPGRVGRSPRCGIASLAAHVVTSGAMTSQPFLVVSLTNRGTTRCHLRGIRQLPRLVIARSRTTRLLRCLSPCIRGRSTSGPLASPH
jgi:hypothetical protein